MQIKGEEFIKKVQIQQEREELERKLNELEEVEMSINTDSVILERNNNIEQNEHELDNIMLGSSNYSNEDNKKKYLILGIVLVVLFLLTIIIIRLLTNDSAVKEDQFTSNSANSTEMKKLSESDNIEENFQKIINERVKKMLMNQWYLKFKVIHLEQLMEELKIVELQRRLKIYKKKQKIIIQIHLEFLMKQLIKL